MTAEAAERLEERRLGAELSPDELAAQIEREKAARVIAQAAKEHVRAVEMAAAPDAEEKAREARLVAGTPVGFAKMTLGLTLYFWQAVILSWFENTLEMVKGSLCTPNGAGKSERIVSTLALWWISVHPQGRVVITTKDSKQLDNQIWPAIERHKDKFPAFDFIERMVRNGTGGFIIGFTTDDPGRAEGWHKINDFTGPLLVIGDEAKSILNAIDMALDRCTYNAKLLTSSPGLTEGFFYKSQTDLAGEIYDANGLKAMGPADVRLGYKAMKVGLIDCPHIPKSRIDNIIATYGPDHWFTRSTLHAEFTDADSDTLFVIPKHVVRDAMKNPPPYVHGGKRAFCDFAAGGAENTFTLKEGNRITQTCWRDADPMRAIARFIQLFVQHDLDPSQIQGDQGGIGYAIIPRFAELGWPIIGVNNESEAMDPTRYPNLAAEDWHEAAVSLARGGYIIPDDEILFGQLTSRRAVATSDAILGIESKKEMAKRGIVSPDRADGVVRVIRMEAEAAIALFDETGLRRLMALARSSRGEKGALDLTSDVVAYEPNSPDPWLTVYERPIIGHSYLLVVNPAKHSEPLESHTIVVMRMGFYVASEGRDVPARLVAKVKKPLKLDSGPLARMVTNLSGWYGKCMVVPVVNDRGDVIDRLKDAGLLMYVRENPEVLKHGRTERMIYGWETNDYTRSQWIGALSEAIRDETLDVEDVETVMQLHQLTAASACRMRDAEAVGVGLKLSSYSSTFVAPEREFFPMSALQANERPGRISESMIS